MENSAKKDKNAKIIILVVTLMLTILFATLAAVIPNRSGGDFNTDNNNNNGGSNNNNNNGGSSHTVSGTLSLNESKTVTLSGSSYVYYRFTPTSSGTYVFTSESTYDTYGLLYDSYWSELTSNDDGGTGQNFKISYNLSSGRTYYIGVKLYNGSSTSARITLSVSKSY